MAEEAEKGRGVRGFVWRGMLKMAKEFVSQGILSNFAIGYCCRNWKCAAYYLNSLMVNTL